MIEKCDSNSKLKCNENWKVEMILNDFDIEIVLALTSISGCDNSICKISIFSFSTAIWIDVLWNMTNWNLI